jgi:hypothetical protein
MESTTGYCPPVRDLLLALAGLRTAGDGSYGPEKIDSPGPAKHEAMSTEELKQAVVAMMLRKDEVEEQNRYVGINQWS